MGVRTLVVGAAIMAMLVWLGPVSVPNWAVVAFVFVVLLPLGVVVSVKRFRQERRLARTIWRALTRR